MLELFDANLLPGRATINLFLCFSLNINCMQNLDSLISFDYVNLSIVIVTELLMTF